MKKHIIYLILLTQLFTSCEIKYKENLSVKKEKISSFPNQNGLVNDFEGVFTTYESKELDNLLSDFKSKTSKEIIIASIDSVEPYKDFQLYTIDLAKKWNIGANNNGNTILILISKNKRKLGLTMGDGVLIKENNIQKIASEVILPNFKKDDYFMGTKKAIIELITIWK